MITFYDRVGNATTNKQIKTTKSKNQLSPVHSKLMLPWKLSLAKWVDEPSPSSLLILEYLQNIVLQLGLKELFIYRVIKNKRKTRTFD